MWHAKRLKMMLNCVAFSLLLSINSSSVNAQIELHDSLRYNVEHCPGYQSLYFFEKNYKNGYKKTQGWIYKIKHPGKEEILEFRIGNWLSYNAEGNLLTDEFIPFDSLQMANYKSYKKNVLVYNEDYIPSENWSGAVE